jgi:hypothetical protein
MVAECVCWSEEGVGEGSEEKRGELQNGGKDSEVEEGDRRSPKIAQLERKVSAMSASSMCELSGYAARHRALALLRRVLSPGVL